MKRRSAIRNLVAGGALAGLNISSDGAAQTPSKLGEIPKRVFGKTGERLTVIGQAGGRFPLIS